MKGEEKTIGIELSVAIANVLMVFSSMNIIKTWFAQLEMNNGWLSDTLLILVERNRYKNW